MVSNQNSSNRIPDYRELTYPQSAIPNRRLPAWFLSFLMHTCLFLAVLLALRTVQRGASDVEKPVEGAEGTQGSQFAAQPMSGTINSREDAIRALDKVCDYFKQHEPSSPVPLLLQRAKRLVAKDFIEIIRDLTPAGVAQAEEIGGILNQK